MGSARLRYTGRFNSLLVEDESLVAVFEGTLSRRYVVTDKRVIESDTEARLADSYPFGQIVRTHIDGWGDLHLTISTGKRESWGKLVDGARDVTVHLKCPGFSARKISKEMMALIPLS